MPLAQSLPKASWGTEGAGCQNLPCLHGTVCISSGTDSKDILQETVSLFFCAVYSAFPFSSAH